MSSGGIAGICCDANQVPALDLVYRLIWEQLCRILFKGGNMNMERASGLPGPAERIVISNRRNTYNLVPFFGGG